MAGTDAGRAGALMGGAAAALLGALLAAGGPAAAQTEAAAVVGTWRCASEHSQEGVLARSRYEITYGADGAYLTRGATRYTSAENESELDYEWRGVWRVGPQSLTAELTEAAVKRFEVAGGEVDAATIAGFEKGAVASGPVTFTIAELTATRLVLTLPDGFAATCER